jgi:ATP-dependent DNA helicase DinG
MLSDFYKEQGLLHDIYGNKYRIRKGQVDYSDFIYQNLDEENLFNLVQKKKDIQSEELKELENDDAIPNFIIAEAGTGIGKTIGYSIPILESMILNFKKSGYRCQGIISMSSKTLQDQIYNKDLPILQKLFFERHEYQFSYCMAKGKSNYICSNKLARYEDKDPVFVARYRTKIQQAEGEIERIFPEMNKEIIEFLKEVRCEEKCFSKCPYSQCHFKTLKSKIKTADVIVVNHNYYLSSCKIPPEMRILPSICYMVIDEAHKFADIAKDTFQNDVSTGGIELFIRKFLNALETIERIREHWVINDKYVYSEKVMSEIYGSNIIPESVQDRKDPLREDIAEMKGVCVDALNKLITWISETFREYCSKTEDNTIRKYRRYPKDEDVEKRIEEIESMFHDLHRATNSTFARIKEFCDFDYNDKKIKNPKVDYIDVFEYKKKMLDFYQKIVASYSFMDECYYMCEVSKMGGKEVKNITLIEAYIEANTIMKEHNVWKDLAHCPIILTSATLSVNKNFDFFTKELGITKYKSQQFESPFNYKEQCTIFCPQTTYSKAHENADKYDQTNSEVIKQVLEICPGNSLFLFTAITNMKRIVELLRFKYMKTHKIYVQYEQTRVFILEEVSKWKKGDQPFLIFATATFYTGIDIPVLHGLFIMNIPFLNVKDPAVEAKVELLKKRGQNDFLEYILPDAIITIKQMAGRMIRNENHKGILVIMDSRIITKNYGSTIQNNLPHVDDNIYFAIEGVKNVLGIKTPQKEIQKRKKVVFE